MDRRKFFAEFAANKAAAETRLKKLLEEQAEAKRVFEESQRPQQNYIAASARVRDDGNALDALKNNAEAQLRLHAEPFLKPARERLFKEQQESRGLLDRGGGVSNRLAVEARLKAINEAIQKLDALAVSGEDDLTTAAKRVLLILTEFEIDPKYDVNFAPPAAKSYERFELVEANHVV